MHIFHKWQPVFELYDSTFLGKTIERKRERFRECKVCGKIQEYKFDSQGGCWSSCSNQEIEIIKQAIENKELFV